MKDTRTQLADLIQKKRNAQITFANPEADTLNGFPLRLGGKLLLLASVVDFHTDGYFIVDVSDMGAIRSNKYERFSEKILKAEGQADGVSDVEAVDLHDWKSALQSLKETGENIIIEWMDDGELVFFIGQVARLTKHSVSFRQFDGTGQWWSPWPIPYESIVDIQFRNEYIGVLSKYVKPWSSQNKLLKRSL